MPELWKTSYITPLPKKSPQGYVESDLKPVSLTPIVSKVLEQRIKAAIAHNIHPR